MVSNSSMETVALVSRRGSLQSNSGVIRPSGAKELSCSLSESDEFQCNNCSAVFYLRRNFIRHVHLCEMNRNRPKALLPCPVPQCVRRFYLYKSLLRHLELIHEYVNASNYDEFTFANVRQLEIWLSEHQLQTYTYSVKKGHKQTPNGCKYYYYVCQCDAARQYKLRPVVRKQRRRRGVIPAGFCPARICVKEHNDGSLRVKHFPIHNISSTSPGGVEFRETETCGGCREPVYMQSIAENRSG